LKCFKCPVTPGQSEAVCRARLNCELACCHRNYSGSTLQACLRYAHTRYFVCTLDVSRGRYYSGCPCYCSGDPGQACNGYPRCDETPDPTACYMNRSTWCMICETCNSTACADCPQGCIDLGCPHCVEQ
jgi:hypothetical protein